MTNESYLIEAHVIRFKPELQFLLLKRSSNEKYAGVWQMVTGTIENGEKAFNTALREIKEETGLQPNSIWVVPHINKFYSPEKDNICQVPVFVVKVDSDHIIKLSNEHCQYIWTDLEQAKKLLAWPGQKKSVTIIDEYFSSANSLLKFVKIDLNNNK